MPAGTVSADGSGQQLADQAIVAGRGQAHVDLGRGTGVVLGRTAGAGTGPPVGARERGGQQTTVDELVEVIGRQRPVDVQR
jgi:hypothetical protein